MAPVIGPKTFDSVLAVLCTRAPTSTRLEPQTAGGDPGPGVAATLHDPLWLLVRQWQFGEFAGEDAGTPLAVRVDATAEPMDAFRPGDWAETYPVRPEPFDASPLAMRVEREAPRAPGLRARVEAGSALLIALRDEGLSAAAEAVTQFARLPVAASDPQWPLLSVLAGRAVDAKLVADAVQEMAPGQLPPWLDDAAHRNLILEVTGHWLSWYRPDTAPQGASWLGRKLEHRYSVGAGDVTLQAPEAADGVADWWSFDADGTRLDFGRPAPPAEQLTHRSVATPLRYPGMPADRWWEFEDATIDLGAVESQPHDLARLLVAECALIYGCDWLTLPIDVPSASLVRVQNILYRTTFGETFRAAGDRDRGRSDDGSWRMFAVTEIDEAWDDRVALDGLVVPPLTAARIEGPPVEEVLFLRDEAANVAWAVERVIEDVAGDPRPRDSERHDDQPGDAQHPEAELDYLLQTAVPRWWIPYVPRIATQRHPNGMSSVNLRLARAAMNAYGPDHPEDGTPITARGVLLTGADLALLDDAELPRDGIKVQRVPVLVRRPDGSYDGWVTRRVGVGRGEGGSGLRFDSAVPRPVTLPEQTHLEP